MQSLFAFTILSGFIALAAYSYPSEPTYDVEGMNRLVATSKPLTHTQRQAKALAEIFNVEADDAPIKIFEK